MNDEIRAAYAARAAVAKALAHPSRLAILDALSHGPMCVFELRRLIGSRFPTVSKHLAVMKNAGLIADERRGPRVYYRLRCPCALDFFACAEGVLRAETKPRGGNLSARRRGACP